MPSHPTGLKHMSKAHLSLSGLFVQLPPFKVISCIICTINRVKLVRVARAVDMLCGHCHSSYIYISVVTAYLGPPAVQPGWIKGLSGDVTHPLAAMLEHQIAVADAT